MRRLPPQSSMGLTQETRGKLVVFLEKVEQSEKWPQQACTTMFFLIPENVTSGRPIALMPTLIRWCEAVWALEVVQWQQRYRIDWDATCGQNGGAQRTVWENLMEMEWFKYRAGEEDLGATHFSFPRKILRVLCGYFEHQKRVQFEGCLAEPLRTITAILPGPKWSCLSQRVVLQDASSEVTKNYPPLELRVFVDDITALLMGKNKLVAEMGKKVTKRRS